MIPIFNYHYLYHYLIYNMHAIYNTIWVQFEVIITGEHYICHLRMYYFVNSVTYFIHQIVSKLSIWLKDFAFATVDIYLCIRSIKNYIKLNAGFQVCQKIWKRKFFFLGTMVIQSINACAWNTLSRTKHFTKRS